MRFFKIFVRDTHIYWYYCHFPHPTAYPSCERAGVGQFKQKQV